MFYKIDDIQRDARVDATDKYCRLVVYASYWTDQASHDKGDKPLWREQHFIDSRRTHVRIVTNDKGELKLADGSFISRADLKPGEKYEFEREEYAVDVKARITEVIESYIASGVSKRGAHLDKYAQPTRNDPSGILLASDEAKGAGKVVEED